MRKSIRQIEKARELEFKFMKQQESEYKTPNLEACADRLGYRHDAWTELAWECFGECLDREEFIRTFYAWLKGKDMGGENAEKLAEAAAKDLF